MEMVTSTESVEVSVLQKGVRPACNVHVDERMKENALKNHSKYFLLVLPIHGSLEIP